MSTNTRSTIDLESWDDGRKPTRAVAAAALLLGDADTIDASCYGWVPQAHAALAAALAVEEMARAIDPAAFGNFIGVNDAYVAYRRDEATKTATRIRAAILGEEPKNESEDEQ